MLSVTFQSVIGFCRPPSNGAFTSASKVSWLDVVPVIAASIFHPQLGNQSHAMCGRINLRMSPAELQQAFDLFREPEWLPRYNLGPMQKVLAVRWRPGGVRAADPLQWGLVPSWAKDPKAGPPLVNARGETVASKPAFRSAFKSRRCLIPANGYYEWQMINSKSKQPWHIFPADGGVLACAGLWELWQAPDGSVLESCAIITTTPNHCLSEIHDRMPVILAEEHWSLWLDPEMEEVSALTELLVPCPDDVLEKTPVSSLVNSVRNDSPECLTPIKLPRNLF